MRTWLQLTWLLGAMVTACTEHNNVAGSNQAEAGATGQTKSTARDTTGGRATGGAMATGGSIKPTTGDLAAGGTANGGAESKPVQVTVVQAGTGSGGASSGGAAMASTGGAAIGGASPAGDVGGSPTGQGGTTPIVQIATGGNVTGGGTGSGLATSGALAGSGSVAGPGITVNLDQPKQTMDGFGINDSWAPAMTDGEADALFHPTRGLGLSILRVGMGSDGAAISSNIQNDIAKAIARGVKAVIGSTWSPPAQCKDNHTVNGGGHLLASCYESWATSIAKFAKDNGLYAMSIANEPDFASCGTAEPCNGTYPTTVYTAEEMVAFVKVAGPKLHAAGVKVIAPEPAEWLHLWSSESATGSEPGMKNSSDPLRCGFPASPTQCPLGKGYDYGHALYLDADAWAAFDIMGTHQYNTQKAEPWPSDVPAQKTVWMTEMSGIKWWPEQGPSRDINNGIAVAGWIHDALVNGMASAWIWWSYRANYTDDNEGLILRDGTDTKRHYTLGNFSRFIRPGYERVGLGGSNSTDVLLSAYAGPDGTVVIVAINKSTAPATLPITISGISTSGGGSIASVVPWVTSASDDLAAKSPLPVNGGTFTALLEGKSVTTFVSSSANVSTGDCPPCIADAIAACTPTGDCSATGGGVGSQIGYYYACYAGGIRLETDSYSEGNVWVNRAIKAGADCYTITKEYETEARAVTVMAGDNLIAQGSVDQNGRAIIDCAGTSYVLGDACGAPPSISNCTLSVCP